MDPRGVRPDSLDPLLSDSRGPPRGLSSRTRTLVAGSPTARRRRGSDTSARTRPLARPRPSGPLPPRARRSSPRSPSPRCARVGSRSRANSCTRSSRRSATRTPHETLPEMALDDTDDSAGPGRGARASGSTPRSSPRSSRPSRSRPPPPLDAPRASSRRGAARRRRGRNRRRRARPRRRRAESRREVALVPGDLVRLAAGDKAPADCVLVDHPETTSAIVEVDEEEASPPALCSRK